MQVTEGFNGTLTRNPLITILVFNHLFTTTGSNQFSNKTLYNRTALKQIIMNN